MIDRTAPFVLLDDARSTGASPARLYRDPIEIITADSVAEVADALGRVRAALAAGRHVAGFLAYDAGAAFEPTVPAPGVDGGPLAWFGIFDRVATVPADAVAALLPDPAGGWAGVPVPLVERAGHAAAVDRVQRLIAAGDIYQTNLTFPCRVPVAGHPLALYARLRAASCAGWGGVVFTGTRWLLSCSPELFFTLDADGTLRARPMKGTANPASDPAALAADPKQRAENLMIVDLIRNDLARVAAAGSVTVPALFEVERYPTVLQMTSQVAARLAPGRDAVDVLAATFPCGSVTGAPKIRAMQVIHALEPHRRGPYTGAIGHFAPDGSAAFNVAIRTLDMLDGADHARLGLGSGIVADSTPASEWRECLAKGAFVTAGQRPFDLIETMRFDAADGFVDLDRHLARMKASADHFGIAFNRHDVRNELQAATFRLKTGARVRLLLSPTGRLAVEVRPLPPAPVQPVAVAIAPLPVATADFRLRHKTSDRAFYDDARRAAGTFEVLFVDPTGFLTEGSFTSLFVPRDGRLLTPPLARGLQPGILRARLLEAGDAIEHDLRVADLRDGFLLGNALRGTIAARLVADAGAPAL